MTGIVRKWTLLWMPALLLAPFSVTCFDPQPQQCLPCQGICPSGQECIGGVCQHYPGECTCGQTCCIDDDCFDMGQIKPAALALWLDWTSLDESESGTDWIDRSPSTHTIANDGARTSLGSVGKSGLTTVHFSVRDQGLELSAPDQLMLDQRDFLMLFAGSLNCEALENNRKQCLLTRFDAGRGVRLCISTDPAFSPGFMACARGDETTCLTAVALPLTCDEVLLFSLRRFSVPAAEGSGRVTRFELRQNGMLQHQTDRPLELDIETMRSLRISGRNDFSFYGEAALAGLIVGTISARKTCELESFVLMRLAARGVASAQPADCSQLSDDSIH